MAIKIDRTVEALKSVFDGKTPEEIDCVVRELKETLDKAAEDIKGEMDIGSTVSIEQPCEEIESDIEAIVVKPINKLDKPSKLKIPTDTFDTSNSSFYEYSQDGLLDSNLFPIEIVSEEICDDINPLIEIDDNFLNDPIQPFGDRLFNEKLSKIEVEIYSKYKVKKHLSKIKTLSKINKILTKAHLSKLCFSIDKHKKPIYDAIKEVILKINHLDDNSIDITNRLISDKSSLYTMESYDSNKPVLYANPL